MRGARILARAVIMALVATAFGCSTPAPAGKANTGGAGTGVASGSAGTSGGGSGVSGSAGAGNGLASRPQPKGDFTVGTPVAAGPWAGTPDTAGNVPVIVYPSSETRFPRNIYRTLFQWKTAGMSQFRLKFDGPGTHVTVYSDGKHADCAKATGAGCWEADEESWFLISYGNAGQTVTVTIDGLDTTTTPATVRRAKTITIGFSKQDVQGAIFYWSTTSAGIRRANISASAPEDYITGKPSTTYTNPADAVKCVACHVVSRDGKYLVAPVDAMSGQSIWVTEVTKDAPPHPLVKQIANTKGHGFATISPDDATVIAAFGGKMWTVDRATGAFGANLDLGGLQGTHPDWSPDGSQVVFATGEGDGPAGASLAVLPFSGGKWGTPKTIVAAAAATTGAAGTGGTTTGAAGMGGMMMPGGMKPPGGMMMMPGGMMMKDGPTNLFPMHSPDGKWIAFSRGQKGGHGDLTYQLWTVGAQGGTPVELTNANRVVSNQVTDGTHENAQPTWAPPGDYHWVAFNSVREYGVVLPKGTQQIWVAAIDPAKLAQGGVDPSFPAFRLQFQGLEEDNHRAYWTLDVRYPDPPPVTPPPPPADGGSCVADYAACDPVADRCCGASSHCDSADDGVTYKCTPIIVQ
jgi:hypothetical protein